MSSTIDFIRFNNPFLSMRTHSNLSPPLQGGWGATYAVASLHLGRRPTYCVIMPLKLFFLQPCIGSQPSRMPAWKVRALGWQHAAGGRGREWVSKRRVTECWEEQVVFFCEVLSRWEESLEGKCQWWFNNSIKKLKSSSLLPGSRHAFKQTVRVSYINCFENERCL